MIKFKTIFGATLLVTVCCIFTAAAQTKRKPKPLATPLPTLSGAEIISRAGDYSDPSTTTSTPQKTTQKIPSATSTKIRDLSDRLDRLETSGQKEDAEAKQRRMLLNLDILTRAEQRSEGLRKQLFELSEKENSIRTRVDQIAIDSRPELVERELQVRGGSLRPEEIREARTKSLAAEKANLENLLSQLQLAKSALTLSLEKADALVEKLRTKLDKEIDEDFLKADPDRQ